MDAKSKPNNGIWLQIAAILLGITGLFAYAVSKFTSGRLVVIITGLGALGLAIALTLLAFWLKKFWRILKALGISLLSVIAGTYLLLFGFVFFFQDAIANRTSSFFQPKTIPADAAQALVASDVTPIDLVTPDGIHLRGWLVRNTTETKSPVVIYFGGSGSESSEVIPFSKRLNGWSVALVNYRGFGLSEGIPTQSNALSDALLIYDMLTKRMDIDSSRIVSMGYSLGTGVAVSLSAQRHVAGTILVAPYDYWTLIGVKQTPLYAPLSGIMKHYFASISLAPKIRNPILCLTGSNDSSVPPELSRRLADAWGGQVTSIEYPGEDHGLLFHENTSWEDIANFLQSVQNK
jgi:uncharacterized protein